MTQTSSTSSHYSTADIDLMRQVALRCRAEELAGEYWWDADRVAREWKPSLHAEHPANIAKRIFAHNTLQFMVITPKKVGALGFVEGRSGPIRFYRLGHRDKKKNIRRQPRTCWVHPKEFCPVPF